MDAVPPFGAQTFKYIYAYFTYFQVDPFRKRKIYFGVFLHLDRVVAEEVRLKRTWYSGQALHVRAASPRNLLGRKWIVFLLFVFSLNLPSKYWHLCQPPIHLLNNWAKLVRQPSSINLFDLFQHQRISQYLSISIIFVLHIAAGRRTEVFQL